MKTKIERLRFGIYLGCGMGLMMFSIFCDYSLGFYYGSSFFFLKKIFN